MKNKSWLILLALIVNIVIIPVFAKSSSSGDIIYITGGIGEDEKIDFEANKKDYNVYITSANGAGEYVAGQHIIIYDYNNNILLNIDAGPLLYVSLPKGTYKLEATNGNQKKAHSFKVGNSPENIYLTWK